MNFVLATSLWGDLAPGHFTQIDLIAATTKAFNAALIVRRPTTGELHDRRRDPVPDHRGIAGGVRDIIHGEVPAPLLNPWYLFFCVDAAVIAIHYREHRRDPASARA